LRAAATVADDYSARSDREKVRKHLTTFCVIKLSPRYPMMHDYARIGRTNVV